MNFIDKLLCWIGQFLGWLDKTTGSYTLALFIFAFVVELLLLPIAIKQQKTSIKQARLRPKEMAIRKKYAGRNDQATQQKVAQEIQEMYQKENFNPLSGCLPLLLQMPVILALYQIVINPLHYVMGVGSEAIKALQAFVTAAVDAGGLGMTIGRSNGTIVLIDAMRDNWAAIQSKFVAFIEGGGYEMPVGTTATSALGELEGAVSRGLPDFSLFGINLGEIPDIKKPSWLWLVPVLTFVVYFFSMRLTRKFSYQPSNGQTEKQTSCTNTFMDITMPLMSVYFTFVVPASIGVYWIFKSILGTVKQFILSRVMPMPTFTEEDYKAAEREYAGKPASKEKRKLDLDANRGNPKSLFHIDDEDYTPPSDDDTFDTEKRIAAEKTGAIETAPLKEDKRREKKSAEKDEKKDEKKDGGNKDGKDAE